MNKNYAATGSGNGFISHCSRSPVIKLNSQLDTISPEEKVNIALTFNSNAYITNDISMKYLKIDMCISDVLSTYILYIIF